MTESDYEKGLRTRKAILGENYVDNALAGASELDADFQSFVTEVAWGKLWSRDAITARERSMVVIGLLAALGHDAELALHLGASRNTGTSLEDLKEVLLHVAVYAGVPAANRAFRIAREVFQDGD